MVDGNFAVNFKIEGKSLIFLLDKFAWVLWPSATSKNLYNAVLFITSYLIHMVHANVIATLSRLDSAANHSEILFTWFQSFKEYPSW